MKKWMLLLLPILLVAVGCSHTSTLKWTPALPGQVSASGKAVKWNLVAENKGMYLFYFIPLWNGYPTRPNRHDYEIGKHLLSRPHMRRMLDCKLDKLEADHVEDVKISEKSSGMLGLWIIWMRSMRAEGVAVTLGK